MCACAHNTVDHVLYKYNLNSVIWHNTKQSLLYAISIKNTFVPINHTHYNSYVISCSPSSHNLLFPKDSPMSGNQLLQSDDKHFSKIFPYQWLYILSLSRSIENRRKGNNLLFALWFMWSTYHIIPSVWAVAMETIRILELECLLNPIICVTDRSIVRHDAIIKKIWTHP